MWLGRLCVSPQQMGCSCLIPAPIVGPVAPPLLGAAASVAVSLNRNLVVQTKDSIQIFSINVLTSDETPNDVLSSHIYPLGENHIVCLLQQTRHLALLKLETLQEFHPNNTLPLWSSLLNLLQFAHTSFLTHKLPFTSISPSHGLVTGVDIALILQAWQSGAPLLEQAVEGVLLSGLSPQHTWVITIHSLPQLELSVKDTKHGVTVAKLPLEHGKLEMGRVYGLTFDSETRFYLKIDEPGLHIQVPYDIVQLSPPGLYSHKVLKGEPVPLLEPQVKPPYTLDANCEWVLDTMSRKVCWISPGNMRKGKGGHFWAGLSLVMVGDDGVVRKLTLKDPEC